MANLRNSSCLKNMFICIVLYFSYLFHGHFLYFFARAAHGQTRTPGITKEVTLARLTERFTEKIKVLEKECSR